MELEVVGAGTEEQQRGSWTVPVNCHCTAAGAAVDVVAAHQQHQHPPRSPSPTQAVKATMLVMGMEKVAMMPTAHHYM